MIKQILAYIRKSDLVVEVLDAREPDLTRSKRLENYVMENQKKLLIVLNKGDLIPVEVLEKWKKFIEENEGIPTIYISATRHLGTKVLREKIKELIEGEGKIIFIGYPKTGKSSIINALKGRHSATTSKHPMSYGYTRSIQLFRIDNRIFAWDTPGIIPPDGNELERIIRGANVDKLEDPVRGAKLLIERIEGIDKSVLRNTYKIDYSNYLDFLEKLALKRGWILKTSHEPNIDEAAKAFIRDYHEGKIIYYLLPENVNK
ncbi:GTPase [Sulfolobus acidocaldarius]|uniref:GTP-binding protein n=4 Tax=Sulfolobus acidocaldarius TaxID=2285 RepID=Q4J8K3_SULAC|nr:GTPase [Sulfolobus acidocaldarius]AAY80876.1 GTP-binding protein [Sulfolobus acidocaldarius DSM 639]AGE71476.1 GTP-binding protein [Sulfolobus acidocaldarius N8]AGE73749.1 GTP-binding protein [Sulfolobus acidocaldarius Ron12/I]ALU30291.1 GTP-binding protein [Sulfolobus acidocaldarius]ALU31008.1 GTP-binding protein [Sulfolobus acidocaldarius]